VRTGPSSLLAGLWLALALLAAWAVSCSLADEPRKPVWPAPSATAAPAASAQVGAKPSPARSGRKAVAYVPGKVENGGTIRVKTVLSKAAALQTIPLNKDEAGCGHASMTSELCVFDPATLALANSVVGLADITTGKEWGGEFAEAGREVVLDQQKCRYVPHVMLVRQGAKVAIKNSDPVQHTVKSFLNNRGTDAFSVMSSSNSLIDPSDGTTLTKPGNYLLFCDIHFWMTGFIRAVPSPYWGVTGADGLVTLTDVPPGQYKLVCWHEGMRLRIETQGAVVTGYVPSNEHLKDQIVTVEPGGTVDVTFTLDPK
jgi:plastocyanin